MSKFEKLKEEMTKLLEANAAELKEAREEFDRVEMNDPHGLLKVGHRISELCEERDFLLRFQKSLFEGDK